MTMKSEQTSKIGKKFQDAREVLGLSVVDVSSKTLINTDFILGIESGDYSIFPARMFALRYFEKYADFLEIQQEFFDLYKVNTIPTLENKRPSDTLLDDLKAGKGKFVFSVISGLVIIGIVFNWIYSQGSLSEAVSPRDFTQLSLRLDSNQPLKTLVEDRQLIDDAVQAITPLLMPSGKEPLKDALSEFQVISGEIAELSLSFTEDSWLEVYQGLNQLIYRLFKRGENLDISIKPPFQIIAGNARGVTGFYGESEINFTQVANELNVSVIEIENE